MQRPAPERAVAFGLFAVRQALAAGYSRAEVQRCVRKGMWCRVERGILAVAGRSSTPLDPILVAVLRAGPHAAASHETAASLLSWPLLQPASTMHLTVPSWHSHVRTRPGTVAHRSDGDVSLAHGLVPTTTPCRTAVDLAGTLGSPADVVAADSALRTGSLTLDELWQELAGRDEWQYRGRARRALARASERSGSVPETLARLLLADAGLPPPVEQLVITVGGRFVARVDLGWPAERVVVEIDGYLHHSDRTAFQRDRSRQNELVLAGWTVLRFTVEDLTLRPERTVAEVRAALAGATATAPAAT